jgi:hypothetical protein
VTVETDRRRSVEIGVESGAIAPHVGAALHLQYEIATARTELAEYGTACDETWAVLEDLAATMVERMPPDPPRRR